MAMPQPARPERPEEGRVTAMPVRAISPEEERNVLVDAAERSVASPMAMGLTTFGITTFLAGIVGVGWYYPESLGFLVPVGFFFGGIVQLLAGMWGFRKRDNMSATLFTSYGAFWLTLSTLMAGIGTGAIALTGGAVMGVLGFFFAIWAAVSLYLWIASMADSVSLTVVTGLLFAASVILAVGAFTDTRGVIVAGSAVAIASGLAAWYAAGAHLIHSTFEREVFPVWRTRRSHTEMPR